MRAVRPPMASYPARAGEGTVSPPSMRVARGMGNGVSLRRCVLLLLAAPAAAIVAEVPMNRRRMSKDAERAPMLHLHRP